MREATRLSKQGIHVNRQEYYAKAKAEAALKPPNINTRSNNIKLFGGALTREYRQWYYRTMCAAREAQAEGNPVNWPEFFAKAREVELRRQGLTPSTPTALTTPTTLPKGERLMFDFSIPRNTEHHLITDQEH